MSRSPGRRPLVPALLVVVGLAAVALVLVLVLGDSGAEPTTPQSSEQSLNEGVVSQQERRDAANAVSGAEREGAVEPSDGASSESSQGDGAAGGESSSEGGADTGTTTAPGSADAGAAPEGESPTAGGEPTAGRHADPSPSYLVAAVRRGATVTVHSSPGGEVVGRADRHSELGSPMVFSVVESRRGWLRVSSDVGDGNRSLWIRRSPRKLRFSRTRLAVRVDLSERRIVLWRGDEPAGWMPVTIGAPGSETPTGRFAVTDIVTRNLNPVYGCCAIALSAHQPNLPAGWIGGDRVAIHGTTGPVGNAASTGCLRGDNRDVLALAREVPLGTPVFIRA